MGVSGGLAAGASITPAAEAPYFLAAQLQDWATGWFDGRRGRQRVMSNGRGTIGHSEGVADGRMGGDRRRWWRRQQPKAGP